MVEGVEEKPDAKVSFRCVNQDNVDEVETLWAHALGNDRYKLMNLPCYAYGVSVEDVVYAPYTEEEGRPTFAVVDLKSGNRTFRLVFDEPIEAGSWSDRLLDEVVGLGCSVECFTKHYAGVSVPMEVSADDVTEIFGRCNIRWEQSDPEP